MSIGTHDGFLEDEDDKKKNNGEHIPEKGKPDKMINSFREQLDDVSDDKGHRENNGETEVEIQSGDRPPITLRLPSRVANWIQCNEQGKILQDPASELTDDYRAWDEGASATVQDEEKSITNCFCDRYDPFLLNWTLENFSDPSIQLNDTQRADLIYHIVEETEDNWNDGVPELEDTRNAESLEYCWYNLVKLIAIKERLQNTKPSNELIDLHVSLIHSIQCNLISNIGIYHRIGWLTTDSPRQDIVDRLIDLASTYPHLRSHATRIISDWDSMEMEDEHMKIMMRSRNADFDEDDTSNGYGSDLSTHALFDKEAHDILMQKLRHLEEVMTPETDDDHAWDHPLEYVEQLAEGKHAIYLNSPLDNGNDQHLSNGSKFDFALMERMAEKGFKNWLFTEPDYGLDATYCWLQSQNDSRSKAALARTLHQYMQLKRGNDVPALREYLILPDGQEPKSVTSEMCYWQEVWKRKEDAGVEARVYLVGADDENKKAMDWMQATEDKKFIVISDGGVFQENSYSHGCTTRDASIVLYHSTAIEEYDREDFMSLRAMKHVAHEIGRKRGWGSYQTSAVPVKDNFRLIDAFAEGTLIHLHLYVTSSGGYIDAVIFSCEGENDDGEEEVDPYDEYITAPQPEVGAPA